MNKELWIFIIVLIGAVIYGIFIRQEPGLYEKGGACYGFDKEECEQYLDIKERVGSADRPY